MPTPNRILSLIAFPLFAFWGFSSTSTELFSQIFAPARAAASTSEGTAKADVKKEAPAKAAADSPEISRLKAVDQKYVAAKSIAMDLTKTVKLAALGREKKSQGRLVISKGRLRMDVEPPEKSLVVIDKSNAWVVNYPPAEFKDAPLQVVKSQVGSQKGRGAGLVSLLASGGLLKQFSVSSVQKEGEKIVYFLQPKKPSPDFKRAHVVLAPKDEQIQELRYWDELDNETRFEFSNVVFDKTVDPKSFQFTPPAGADVTVY